MSQTPNFSSKRRPPRASQTSKTAASPMLGGLILSTPHTVLPKSHQSNILSNTLQCTAPTRSNAFSTKAGHNNKRTAVEANRFIEIKRQVMLRMHKGKMTTRRVGPAINNYLFRMNNIQQQQHKNHAREKNMK